MNEPLSKEELERIKALCERATPGPWHVHFYNVPNNPIYAIEDDNGELAQFWGGTDPEEWPVEANSEFAAEARTGWPKCVAEIERLKGLLENISLIYCGVKVEGEITHDMVPAFVEGAIDQQADLVAKRDQLICDFQAAAMIDVADQGGPCMVKPEHVEKHVTELRTELTRLQTELAEARKDKERLDGLIELAKFTQLTFSISFNGYADLQLQSGRCFSDFTNPRLLIDAAVAAMKATPQ